MFRSRKNVNKINIDFEVNESDGSYFSSKSKELNPEDVYSQLQFIFNKTGKFVIDNINENTISITTMPTLENNKKEAQVAELAKYLDSMKQDIENYIKDKAIKMKAYSVCSNGKLIDVYVDKIMAQFIRRKLEREGYENVEIKEINIK